MPQPLLFRTPGRNKGSVFWRRGDDGKEDRREGDEEQDNDGVRAIRLVSSTVRASELVIVDLVMQPSALTWLSGSVDQVRGQSPQPSWMPEQFPKRHRCLRSLLSALDNKLQSIGGAST